MAINLTKAGIAIGVGVVSEVLDRMDENAHRTKRWERWGDWAPLVFVVGGHALGMVMPRHFELGETAATAATPLLVKNIAATVMKPKALSYTATRQPAAAVRAQDWINHEAAGGGYRPMS